MTGPRRETTSATRLTANDANNDRLTYSLEMRIPLALCHTLTCSRSTG